MQTPSLSARWNRSPAARHHASRERRLALWLVAIIGAATVSVLATTSTLSQHHAREVAALTRP
ncbi:MAG TPA: hypothetical protein VGU45_16155 [Microvirga sp.]|jgi:type VI protein secretion system component VasF|nr:hypothetical protein [Microvirga sp.]